MQLLIYCAGGFGKEVMDIARRIQGARQRWEGMAFLDDASLERVTYGADVLTLEGALARFGAGRMEVVIANGEPFVRKALREKVEAAGVRLSTLVDSTAVVSETALLGPGCIVFPGCFVSSEAHLAGNVVMIAGALVGHHSSVGENAVISGQVNIGGGCTLGSESYVGMGSQIKENTRVGWASIVGMGSVVFKDIPDEVIALGNPCRPMRPNTSKRIFS
jgi:sugar O-acyltransferase (sialic acid O-acetyltransferase NeuD family)